VAKKRKPGGGRKPKPDKKVMFSLRLDPSVLANLRAAAKKWPGKKVSTFTEYLIDRALREREEEERDPALRALLYLIGQMADHITGAFDGYDEILSPSWRHSLFQFRAFKCAVHKLLDGLEEPPGPLWKVEDVVEHLEKSGRPIHPDILEDYLKTFKSPEARGASLLASFYFYEQSPRPLSEWQRAEMRKVPAYRSIMERRVYGIPQALKALELQKETQPPKRRDDGKSKKT
jgi:hypothetical protein